MILLEVDKLDDIHFSSYNDYVIFGKKKVSYYAQNFILYPTFCILPKLFMFCLNNPYFAYFYVMALIICKELQNFPIHIHGLSFSL